MDNTRFKEGDVKREPCVLLQWFEPDTHSHNMGVGCLIEQLRYAGILRVVKETYLEEAREIEQESGTRWLLEISAPKGMDQRVWVDHNVNRMLTFNLVAEASWKEIK